MDMTCLGPALTMDGQSDHWVCPCGNEPHLDGFYPCDPLGHEVDPDTSAWDGILMACASCEAIIRMV